MSTAEPEVVHGRAVPPSLDDDGIAWARAKCQILYWQVTRGPFVVFNNIVSARQISHGRRSQAEARRDEGEQRARQQVSQFLEYYATERFSGQCQGLKKSLWLDSPVGGCALTGDDRVHAVTNSRDPDIIRLVNEIMELSRNAHRVFQDADLPPSGTPGKPPGWIHFIKRSRNRRRINARRDRSDAAESLYSFLTRVITASQLVESIAPAAEDKTLSPIVEVKTVPHSVETKTATATVETSAKYKKGKVLKGVLGQWQQTRAAVEARIQRHARFEYFTGVILGAFITIGSLAVLGWLAYRYGGHELNQPGNTGSLTAAAIGGTAGAFISVTQRLTRSTLWLDFTASRWQKIFLGMLRPAVGAVFGAVVYFAIIGGLLAIQSRANHNSGIALAFFAVAGFVAGFSERFAAGVLEQAAGGVTSGSWSLEDSEKRAADAASR